MNAYKHYRIGTDGAIFMVIASPSAVDLADQLRYNRHTPICITEALSQSHTQALRMLSRNYADIRASLTSSNISYEYFVTEKTHFIGLNGNDCVTTSLGKRILLLGKEAQKSF